MRKSRQEAAETRERIVSVAAREFNENGIEGTGLADIMAAAGLTHGGFYKHFESKDQLVAEAVSKSLERVILDMESLIARKSLEGTVGEYLSKRHRDDAAEACPLSALGSELRYAEAETKEIASQGVERLISVVGSQLTDLPTKAARARAHAFVSAMVGSMMLSRIVTNKKLSDSLLRDTKDFIVQS